MLIIDMAGICAEVRTLMILIDIDILGLIKEHCLRLVIACGRGWSSLARNWLHELIDKANIVKLRICPVALLLLLMVQR